MKIFKPRYVNAAAKKVTSELAKKILGSKYSNELFKRVIKSDPTAKITEEKEDKIVGKGKNLVTILNWVKKGIIELNSDQEINKISNVFKEFNKYKSKSVPEFLSEKFLERFQDKGPEFFNEFVGDILRKRPRLDDLFSAFDEMKIAQNGEYRVFLIESDEEAQRILDGSRWCVQHLEHFENYSPPFYMFTKGNDFYALLNVEGSKSIIPIDFEEWYNAVGEEYTDDIEQVLAEQFAESDEIEEQINDLLYEKLEEYFYENEEIVNMEVDEFIEKQGGDSYLEEIKNKLYPDEKDYKLSDLTEEQMYKINQRAMRELTNYVDDAFEEWKEDEDTEDTIIEIRDEIRDELIRNYDPPENIIRDYLRDGVFEDYMRGDLGWTGLEERDQGEGVEFNNAGNTPISQSEAKKILPLLLEIFQNDTETLEEVLLNADLDDVVEKLNENKFKVYIENKINVNDESLNEIKEWSMDYLRENFDEHYRKIMEEKGQLKFDF